MAHVERGREISIPPPRGQPYSITIPGSKKEGRTPVYRHHKYKDGLLRSLDPNVTTAHDMFEGSANRHPKSRCLGWRPYIAGTKSWGKYEWMDYATVQRRRANLGAGLVSINKDAGVQESKYGVGIWCQNRPEWQISDLGCMSQSLYSVSLYDTLGPSTTEYIVNHASLPCVITSLPHIPTLLKLKPRLPTLKIIISVDPLDNGDREGYSRYALLNSLASELDVKIYSFEQVEAIGASFGTPLYHPPGPNDMLTINYTSGTTGPPKGVTILHFNAVAAGSCGFATLPMSPKDVLISYLPLAHIYERMNESYVLWAGGAIGFFHGDILGLVDDLQQLKPTFFPSVPRLFNRFGGAIRAATVQQPGFKGSLSRYILSTKQAAMTPPDSPTATNKHAFYDRIWGRKVASAIGLQNATNMVSGSAPLDPSLHGMLRAVVGNTFVQGYGLTETFAQGLCQGEGDLSVGNCGGVSPTMELCLMDVPDMEYYSTDQPQPRGELLMRGNNLFAGYYRNEEETSKAMLPDGWFRTGDVATVDRLGRFQIIDRVKDVLKLAQGEYISPERLENVYLSHLNYLALAFVHGDSLQTFLVGIFAVQPDMFAPLASKILGKQIASTDVAAIKAACDEPKMIKAIQDDLDKVGRKNKFAGYERVRKFRLMVDPFTIDNELLTPTLKLKRPPTAKMYRSVLDQLYADALAEEEQHSRAMPKAKL